MFAFRILHFFCPHCRNKFQIFVYIAFISFILKCYPPLSFIWNYTVYFFFFNMVINTRENFL